MKTSHQRVGIIQNGQRIVYVENHADFKANIGMYMRFIPQVRLYTWYTMWGQVPVDIFKRWWAYQHVNGEFVEATPVADADLEHLKEFDQYIRRQRLAYNKSLNTLSIIEGTSTFTRMFGERTRVICDLVLAGAALTKTQQALFDHFRSQHENVTSDRQLAEMLLAEEELYDARRDQLMLDFLQGL